MKKPCAMATVYCIVPIAMKFHLLATCYLLFHQGRLWSAPKRLAQEGFPVWITQRLFFPAARNVSFFRLEEGGRDSKKSDFFMPAIDFTMYTSTGVLLYLYMYCTTVHWTSLAQVYGITINIYCETRYVLIMHQACTSLLSWLTARMRACIFFSWSQFSKKKIEV